MLETLLQKGDTQERCGFILDDGSSVEIKNVANEPASSYEMDPTEVIEHVDRAVATWHTHPDSDPNLSGEDYRGFLNWPDMQHHIIGYRDGKICAMTFKVEEGVVLVCD